MRNRRQYAGRRSVLTAIAAITLLAVGAGTAAAHHITVTALVRGGDQSGQQITAMISRDDSRVDSPRVFKLAHGQTTPWQYTDPGRRHRVAVSAPKGYEFAGLACAHVPARPGRGGNVDWSTTRPAVEFTVRRNTNVACVARYDRRVTLRVQNRFSGPGPDDRAAVITIGDVAGDPLQHGQSTAPVDVSGRAGTTVTVTGAEGTDLSAYRSRLSCRGVKVTPSGDGWKIDGLTARPAAATVECVMTHRRTTATLTVVTDVSNDNGGTATASDVTVRSTVGGAALDPVPGNAKGTSIVVPAGVPYSITADELQGYAVTADAPCAAEAGLAPDARATCTITAGDIAPQLTVTTRVVNDDGGTRVPADFTTVVTGGNVSPARFPGSESGTAVTLDAGAYEVGQVDALEHSVTVEGDCAGVIALGETRSCTIINDDPVQEPENPGNPGQPENPGNPDDPPGPEQPENPGIPGVPDAAPQSAALSVVARLQSLPSGATYTIVVRSTGRRAARNVVVTNVLSSAYEQVRASHGRIRGTVLTARLGNLPPGSRRTVRVTLRPSGETTRASTATATARATGVRARRATVTVAPLT